MAQQPSRGRQQGGSTRNQGGGQNTGTHGGRADQQNLQAISAPYNFVPLSSWVYTPDWGSQVSHDLPFRDGWSGEIAYTLVAESPLLVGGKQTEANDDNPGEVYPFQAPSGRYAVPGSSLKGMIRAVVEIAGFGRMRMVDDNREGVRDLTPGARRFYGDKMTERAANGAFEPRTHAGWLAYDDRKSTWTITPCQYARVEHDDLARFSRDDWWKRVPRISAAEKYRRWSKPLPIKFSPGPNQEHRHSNVSLFYSKATALGAGTTDGTLVFTGQPNARDPNRRGRKHLEFVFYSTQPTPLDVPDAVWQGFTHIHAHGDEWKFWKNYKSIPVFFLKDSEGSVESLGLALMYRLAYRHSVRQTIEHTSPAHCQTPSAESGYDLADLLFGAVGENPSDALRGRVSFEPAWAKDNPVASRQDATILNGPKPTYYPNYVKQSHNQGQLTNPNAGYSTYMDPQAEVRGFKRYPARPHAQVQSLTTEQRRNNKVQVRLHTLQNQPRFNGRIVFHNLKHEELGALLWALTWGGNAKLRHGLGMGKPFGFGQVRFELDHNDRHLRPNDTESKEAMLHEANLDSFMKDFTSHMEAKHKDVTGHGWSESPQIANLLAMADPNAANDFPGKLQHMRLEAENRVNEFVDAKRVGLVLRDYAAATDRSQADGQSGPVDGPPSGGSRSGVGGSSLHPWVAATLDKLVKENFNANREHLLGGKQLAERWAALEDQELKAAALEAIRAAWRDRGWEWDGKLSGAKKKAKAIYDGRSP